MIELLVVITIIVVLLALLTPALDKAIYSAQLAVCGANLHAVSQGALSYAFEHRRRYPKRAPDHFHDALILRNTINPFAEPFDLRPQFQPYVNLDAFLDALGPQGSLDLDDAGNSPETMLYSSYYVFTGHGMVPGRKTLDRVGQRFDWTDTKDPAAVKPTYNWNIIVSDADAVWAENYDASMSSHPDRLSTMSYTERQDEYINAGEVQGGPVVFPANVRMTISGWSGPPTSPPRGGLDTQFAFEDASVQRYDNVMIGDDRMAKVPETDQSEYDSGRYSQLPKAAAR